MHANKKMLGLPFYRRPQLRRQEEAANSTGFLLPAEKECVVMDARSERSSKREGERSWANRPEPSSLGPALSHERGCQLNERVGRDGLMHTFVKSGAQYCVSFDAAGEPG